MPGWLIVVTLSVAMFADFRIEDADSMGWLVLQGVILGVGVLILANRPGNRIGRILLVAGLAFCSIFLTPIAILLNDAGHVTVAGYVNATLSGTVTLWTPLIAWAFFLFPTGHPPSRPWRWPEYAIKVSIALAFVAPFVVGGIFADPEGVEIPNPIQGIAPLDEVLSLAFNISLALALLISAVSVVYRFARSDGLERQQMKWLGFAMILIAIWIPISFLGSNGAAQEGLIAIGTVLLSGFALVSVGIAVTRYRLYEIDRIISRTVSYALVVALLAAIFLSVVTLLAVLLPTESPIVVAGATLLVAALFNPLRKRLQSWVDHRFNRRKYAAQQVVDVFAASLQEETRLADIVDGLQSVVDETLEPHSVAVWIAE